MSYPQKNLLEICSVKTGKRDANHSVLDGQYPSRECECFAIALQHLQNFPLRRNRRIITKSDRLVKKCKIGQI